MNTAATLRHPALWVGLAGSLVIAAGESRGLSSLVIAAGIAVLALGWLLARPRAGQPPLSWPLVVAVWAAPLLLLPPMLSTDAGSYADLGWMVMNGDNPYTTGLGTTGSPFAYGRAWRGTTSVYPAGALTLFGWIVAATGAHATWSVVALRVLAVAGLAGLVWAVPRLAHGVGVEPAFAVWLAAANPLTLVHGVGGEHVDLLMAGLVAVAAAVALPSVAPQSVKGGRTSLVRLAAAAVLVGLAASVKQPALLAVPAVAALAIPAGRRTWPKVVAASAGVGLGAGATFAAVSAASGLGWGWIDGTGNPANAAQTLTLAYLLALASGLDVDLLTQWGQYLSVGVIAWLFVWHGRREPLRFLGLAALAWVLGFGVLREWYLVFPLAFLGLARPGRALRAVLWVLVPMLSLYGIWKEYGRASVLEAATQSFVWAAALAFMGASLWALTRPEPDAVATPQRRTARMSSRSVSS